MKSSVKYGCFQGDMALLSVDTAQRPGTSELAAERKGMLRDISSIRCVLYVDVLQEAEHME